jgi:hypothetical protein
VLAQVPGNWENCTGEVIQAMRLREYLRHPSTYTSWGGMDFNKYPWFAAAGFKAYRDPSRGGVLCYVIDRECRNDPDGEKGRTEREFILQLAKDGWDPEELLFIADPSGQWQSSEHRKRGGVTAGFSSFDIFRSPTEADTGEGALTIPAWDMFAPTTWRLKGTKHYAHPRKTETLDDCNELLRTRRLFVLERCRHVISAMKKCPLDPHAQGDEKNYWHMLDAIRYAVHRAQGGMDPKRAGLKSRSTPRSSGGGRSTGRSVGFGGGTGGRGGMFGS